LTGKHPTADRIQLVDHFEGFIAAKQSWNFLHEGNHLSRSFGVEQHDDGQRGMEEHNSENHQGR
jgi:hypothetical protein